jgi:hypothetical protein
MIIKNTLRANDNHSTVCCLLFAVCCLLFAVCCFHYITNSPFCQVSFYQVSFYQVSFYQVSFYQVSFYQVSVVSMISFNVFTKISGQIVHNVPAVYDVWAGIKGLCAAKTARPNVPE